MPDLINEPTCTCGHHYADHDELEPGVLGACLQLVGDGDDLADCPCKRYEAQRMSAATCAVCYTPGLWNGAAGMWVCSTCHNVWTHQVVQATPPPAELDQRIKAVLPVAPGSALVVQLAPTDRAEALEGYVNEVVEHLPEGCNVVFVYGDTEMRSMPVTVADVVAAVQGAALDVLSESIDADAATAMAEAVLVLLAERGAWRHG